VRSLATATLLFLVACAPGTPSDDDAGVVEEGPTFARVKDELISLNCSTALCHGGSGPQRELRLDADDVWENLIDVDAKEIDDDTGQPWKLVVPGDPASSLLYVALIEDVDGEWTGSELDRPQQDMQKMPPDIDSLAASKIDLVRDWIEAGANDD
jgi:hypothetical protein